MQSIMGAFLTAGYAAAFGAAISASGQSVSSSVQGALTKSYSSAAELAQRYPKHSSGIVAGARDSFIQGQHWAYLAGIVAVAVGAAVMHRFFPGRRAARGRVWRPRPGPAAAARSGGEAPAPPPRRPPPPP